MKRHLLTCFKMYKFRYNKIQILSQKPNKSKASHWIDMASRFFAANEKMSENKSQIQYISQ